jgi:hypothetical protein
MIPNFGEEKFNETGELGAFGETYVGAQGAAQTEGSRSS